MRPPREPSGVDNRAAQRGAVAAHEFGQRVHDNVGAVIDRTQQDRRRHRVVDNERNSVPGGNCRERLDVANVSRRIANALTEDRARFFVDAAFRLLRPDRIPQSGH